MSHHGRPSNEISRLREALKDAELRNVALEHVKHDLQEKLDAHPATTEQRGDRCLEPVSRLADIVKDVEQARCLLAELTERIAEGLQERDELLAYVLAQRPDAPEKAERERLPQTHNSRIFKLRIGGKDNPNRCGAHLILGFHDDGRWAEAFVQLGRTHRSTLAAGGFHLASRMMSLALQYGASPETVIRQARYQKDLSGGRPWGTDEPLKEPTSVGSLVDYIAVVAAKEVERRKREASGG